VVLMLGSRAAYARNIRCSGVHDPSHYRGRAAEAQLYCLTIRHGEARETKRNGVRERMAQCCETSRTMSITGVDSTRRPDTRGEV